MNRSTSGRLRELDVLFLRCRHQWRDFFYELEDGDASLLAEDPWHDLDEFLSGVEPEHRQSFVRTLEEMVRSGDAAEQARALSIVAATGEPFDLDIALAVEKELRKDLEAHLALLLAIGERRHAAGRAVVEKALNDPSRRHAALIALAQLDPTAAAAHGAETYKKDRERIVLTLGRPLDEHEYATFYQMAEGVLQVRGKDGLNDFLRAVAGSDEKLKHEFALLAKRLLQQAGAATT
jgi:hypothetical protein